MDDPRRHPFFTVRVTTSRSMVSDLRNGFSLSYWMGLVAHAANCFVFTFTVIASTPPYRGDIRIEEFHPKAK
jgi:hypothetical protein